MFGGASGLDQIEHFSEEDAGPAIVEAAPARDAVKVRSDFGLREREKFLPGKFRRSGDFAGDFEVPPGFVEMRNRAIVEDRPFQRERLAGRETAFGARLILELLAVAVGGEQGHKSSSGTFDYKRRRRFRLNSDDSLKEAARFAVLCFLHDGKDFGRNDDTR